MSEEANSLGDSVIISDSNIMRFVTFRTRNLVKTNFIGAITYNIWMLKNTVIRERFRLKTYSVLIWTEKNIKLITTPIYRQC